MYVLLELVNDGLLSQGPCFEGVLVIGFDAAFDR
jgi:hypothetical protein